MASRDSGAPRIIPPVSIPFKWVAGTAFSLQFPSKYSRTYTIYNAVFQNGSVAGTGGSAGVVRVNKNGSILTTTTFANTAPAGRVLRAGPSSTYSSSDNLTVTVVSAPTSMVDGTLSLELLEEGNVGIRLLPPVVIPVSVLATGTLYSLLLPTYGRPVSMVQMNYQNGATSTGVMGTARNITATSGDGNTMTINFAAGATYVAGSVVGVNQGAPLFWTNPGGTLTVALDGAVGAAVNGTLTLLFMEND